MLRRSVVSILASDAQQSLALTLLQTAEGGMFMPDVAVAEVLGWQANSGATVTWRDQVLACKDLSGGAERVCVIICNAIYRQDSHFYALAIKSLPKMVRLTEEDMEDVNANLVYPWQRGWVVVDARRTILPDVEQLELSLT